MSLLSCYCIKNWCAAAQAFTAISLAAEAIFFCAGGCDNQQAAHHHSQAHGLDSGRLDKRSAVTPGHAAVIGNLESTLGPLLCGPCRNAQPAAVVQVL